MYRSPRPANDNNLALARRIDALFTAWPFLGSRRMTAMLRANGRAVNRKRVRRLMRQMGITALGPKPRTTKPAPGHKIFPYLWRDPVIDRPNQFWAADITYNPIGRGFLYLVAIMDWASRAVLAWRLANTMEVSFCVSALEAALAGCAVVVTPYGSTREYFGDRVRYARPGRIDEIAGALGVDDDRNSLIEVSRQRQAVQRVVPATMVDQECGDNTRRGS